MSNIETDKLTKLIKKYNHDNELNCLKDILDYLKINNIYLLSSIKISKQKLKSIPTDDILMIINNLSSSLKSGYFSVYSTKINNSSYYVELSIYDCFKIMKKFKGVTKVIIDPQADDSFILDDSLIAYLKKSSNV